MDKEYIKKALTEAYNMYPYEVFGKPKTYSLYNADYVSQFLGVDID